MTTELINNLIPNMAQTHATQGAETSVSNNLENISDDFSKALDNAKSKYISKEHNEIKPHNKKSLSNKESLNTETKAKTTLETTNKKATNYDFETSSENTADPINTNSQKTDTEVEAEKTEETNKTDTQTSEDNIQDEETSLLNITTSETDTSTTNEESNFEDKNFKQTPSDSIEVNENENFDNLIKSQTENNEVIATTQKISNEASANTTSSAVISEDEQLIKATDITLKNINTPTIKPETANPTELSNTELTKTEDINFSQQEDVSIEAESISLTTEEIENIEDEILVKTEEPLDSINDEIAQEIATNEKDTNKTQTKISQGIIDEMDVTIRSVESSELQRMLQQNSNNNSGQTSGNAQECIIKMSIEGIDNSTTSSFEMPTSTPQIEISNVENTLNLKQVSMPKSENISDTEILSQINSKLTLPQENTTNKVNIILQPENLGKVSVEIMRTNEGISAKMIAESVQIKDLLDKSIETLKNTLASQGVNVNNISVKVEESSASQNANFGFEQEQFNREANQSNQQRNSENSQNKINENQTKSSIENTNTPEDTESNETSETTTDNEINHNGRISISV